MNQDQFNYNASNEHFAKVQEDHRKHMDALFEQENQRRSRLEDPPLLENGKHVNLGASAFARWQRVVWRWKCQGIVKKIMQWILILFLFTGRIVLAILEWLLVQLYFAFR